MNLPKEVIFTTSRDPSNRVRSFLKDLTSLAPWLIRLNRGKMTFEDIVNEAISNNISTIAIIGEMKGNPSIIRIYDLSDYLIKKSVLHSYTLFIGNVSLSREFASNVVNFRCEDMIFESHPLIDEESKNVVFSLSQMFGINPFLSLSASKNVIKIVVKKVNEREWGVLFKAFSSNKTVGPKFKILGIKKVERFLPTEGLASRGGDE